MLAARSAWSAPYPSRSLLIARTDVPPAIDGRLDDACWSSAPVADAFVQVVPVEGAAPSERTEVRVLYDADNLYVAVRCFDSDSGVIIGKQMKRDADMGSDDIVEIVIGPFADRRNGYAFQLGPAGGKTDGLVEGGRTDVRRDWDAIWYGKATIDGDGWSAEFAIPFKSVSFNSAASAWEFNVQRIIRRKQEVVRWASPRANTEISNLGESGSLAGIENVDQGLGLTLKPYLSTGADLTDGGLELKPGFDLFYKLTRSTTLAFTVNTDFAEAEVDERVVNLTRFPIFFPEKRDFFLQDATVFSFGGIFRSPLPFYSRRIGIVNGQQQDILAGVRVTGRERGLNFGLMDVQMASGRGLGAKNLAVGRVVANVFEESTAGLFFTRGDPATTGDNTLAGADFNYRTSRLFDRKVLEAHVWALGTHSVKGPPAAGVESGTDADGVAFGGKVAYPNDDWSWSLFTARYGKHFNPALGFVQRPGTYEVHVDLRRRWRLDRFLRRVDLKANQSVFLDLDRNVQTQEGGLPGLELEDKLGDLLSIEVQLNRDVLTEPFAIASGVTIPPGDYGFQMISATLALAPSRELAPTLSYRGGDYYTGRRTDYGAELDWRPSRKFFGSVGYQYNGIALTEGAFVVRVITARADVIFSPALSWSNTAQYDNVSRNAGINSRARWEIEPGREVFFVVNQGYEVEDGSRFHSTTSSLMLKAGLTFRF